MRPNPRASVGAIRGVVDVASAPKRLGGDWTREVGRRCAWLSDKGEPFASFSVGVESAAIAAKTRHMPPELLHGHDTVSRRFAECRLPPAGVSSGSERS